MVGSLDFWPAFVPLVSVQAGVLLLLVLVPSLVFAPVAGIWTGRGARNRSFPFLPYCAAGTIGCILLVVPFVNLVASLNGRSAPRLMSGPVIAVLYLVWALTLALSSLQILAAVQFGTGPTGPGMLLFLSILVVNIVLLMTSLYKNRRWRERRREVWLDMVRVNRDGWLKSAMTTPFAHAWLGYMLALAHLAAILLFFQ